MVLLKYIMDCMESYTLMEDTEAKDSIYWTKESSGIFSISYAYDILHPHAGMKEEGEWNNIWRIKTQSRIKMFLWLARHQKIMSNAERKRRVFTHNDSCRKCPGIIEDIDHILRHCSRMRFGEGYP